MGVVDRRAAKVERHLPGAGIERHRRDVEAHRGRGAAGAEEEERDEEGGAPHPGCNGGVLAEAAADATDDGVGF